VLENEIGNGKVVDLATRLPIFFYSGKLIPFVTFWCQHKGFSLHSGPIKALYSVKQYVQENYPSKEDKAMLNNELLLSYGLYKEVIRIKENTRTRLQLIIAQFRLGYYAEVIKECNELLEICDSNSIKNDTLYFLSSALYYEKEYIEAMDIAKQCCDLAMKCKNKVFYLNNLINYASILYVYASLQSESEQECLLEKAARNYKIVLEKSKGVNIEAEANALWGLGDMERYRGNNERAGIYLQQALVILKNIGNSYAIAQLEVILKEIE
jgi:tetratricopeptide (TPR) repeat protein